MIESSRRSFIDTDNNLIVGVTFSPESIDTSSRKQQNVLANNKSNTNKKNSIFNINNNTSNDNNNRNIIEENKMRIVSQTNTGKRLTVYNQEPKDPSIVLHHSNSVNHNYSATSLDIQRPSLLLQSRKLEIRPLPVAERREDERADKKSGKGSKLSFDKNDSSKTISRTSSKSDHSDRKELNKKTHNDSHLRALKLPMAHHKSRKTIQRHLQEIEFADRSEGRSSIARSGDSNPPVDNWVKDPPQHFLRKNSSRNPSLSKTEHLSYESSYRFIGENRDDY